MDCDRGMSVRARIQDNRGRGLRGVLYPIHQFTFMIRLPQDHFGVAEPLLQMVFNVLEAVRPIDLRLPRAEQVQVGTIEDVDWFCHTEAVLRRNGRKGKPMLSKRLFWQCKSK